MSGDTTSTQDSVRANRLREIARDLRALARAPFPPAISLCAIADEVSAAASALDRQERHRGMDWAAVRLANEHSEHRMKHEFKGHSSWQNCSCDLAESIRRAEGYCRGCDNTGMVRVDPFAPELAPCTSCSEGRS